MKTKLHFQIFQILKIFDAIENCVRRGERWEGMIFAMKMGRKLLSDYSSIRIRS